MHSFAWWPTVIVLGVATFTDLRSRRIPNWLVLPFLGLGMAGSSWLHGWHGTQQSLEGAGLGLLIYGVLFWMGGMGAGDVKLCAAIGAWIGPYQLFLALVMTGLAGGVIALAMAAWGGFLKELFQHTGDLVFGAKQRGEAVLSNPRRHRMPYAPAIAIGTLMSFFAR
ncbi:MAG: A24 family peptidase [Terracidiphilus sp.]|jgi:prepilin peptidase CpaA